MVNNLLSHVHNPGQSASTACSASAVRPGIPHSALAVLGQRALSGVPLSDLMGEAVALVADTMNVDYVCIVEYQPGTRELRVRADTGTEAGAPSLVGETVDAESPAGRALLSDSPLVVDDFRVDMRFRRAPFIHAQGITSGMTAVVPGREHPYGVLGVFSRFRRAFSQNDVQLLEAFASNLALVIAGERAEETCNHLRSQLLAATTAATESQRRLSFLTGISSVLSRSTDYRSTIKLATRLAVPFLADWCVLDVIDGESVRRAAVFHSDPAMMDLARGLQRYPPTFGQEDSFPKGVAKVLLTGQSRLVSEVSDSIAKADAADAEHLRILRKLGFSSAMCVPLTSAGRTIGAMTFVAVTPDRRFGPADLLAAEDFARWVASALEIARLRDELDERERRLQDLGGKLLEAQEEERRRIAYDVHDGLAQVAASAHQHLQAFARVHLPSSPQAREMLDRALDLARRTVKEARRVIADLRPTTLEVFGLSTAIRLQVDELRAEGWDIDYEETLGSDALPPALGNALFRVLQEALTNVRKHAQTQRVRVVLQRQGQTVRLEVQDWGRGFVPDTARAGAGDGEHLGLISMRERITLLNGRFTVESQLNVGTRVVAEIPLQAFPEGEADHEEANITNAAI